MKKIINLSFFNPVLQYNNQCEERIKAICSPLKKCFDIAYFGYGKVFNDGRYFLVSNCSAWKEDSFYYDRTFNSEFFKTVPRYLSKYKTNNFIWPDNTNDESIEFLKDKKVYNGFSIGKEDAGALEYYFFGTDHDSPLIKEFYKSHLHLLEDFILYFHKITRELIDATDVSRQGIFPFVRNTYPQIETIFKHTTPWEEKIIEFNALLNSNINEEIHEIGKRNLLTSRELQCLSHFSTGMSAKEIARTLDIGYRTVETHLNKIRLKTGCHTKRELSHWFEDRFKHLLTEK